MTKPIDKKHTPKEYISIDLIKYLKFDYDRLDARERKTL